mgnify:CR=1 FL=1
MLLMLGLQVEYIPYLVEAKLIPPSFVFVHMSEMQALLMMGCVSSFLYGGSRVCIYNASGREE